MACTTNSSLTGTTDFPASYPKTIFVSSTCDPIFHSGLNKVIKYIAVLDEIRHIPILLRPPLQLQSVKDEKDVSYMTH